MVYQSIRISCLLLLVGVSIMSISSSTIKQKRHVYVIAFLVCVFIVSVSMIFPPENLFVHFKSPDEAFHYMEKHSITDILEAKDSCMVIYKNGTSEEGISIFPKTGTGYQIPPLYLVKTVSRRLNEYGSVEVYHVKGCSDYYIYASLFADEAVNGISIVDDAGNSITIMDYIAEQVGGFSHIYISLNGAPTGYYLYINGDEEGIPI